MRLNRAILFVTDLPRMAAFYQAVLQSKPLPETQSDTWLEFRTGGAIFALHAIPAHLAPIPSPKPQEDTPIKLAFAVDNLAAEQRRLESLNIPLRPRPWGACDAIDPEGNIFQIYA
jgi:catechol-2,3-dioxygenase